MAHLMIPRIGELDSSTPRYLSSKLNFLSEMGGACIKCLITVFSSATRSRDSTGAPGVGGEILGVDEKRRNDENTIGSIGAHTVTGMRNDFFYSNLSHILP